jgi:hypothetical protein
LIVPAVIWISLTFGGWWSYFAMVFAFGLIPVLEIILPEDAHNLSQAEEELLKKIRLMIFCCTSPILFNMPHYRYISLSN